MNAMKAKDLTIFFVPGVEGAPDGHWLSRWQTKLSTGRMIHLSRPDAPDADRWRSELLTQVESTKGPIALVGHGLGAGLIALVAAELPERVKGGFLVAPPALPNSENEHLAKFGEYSREPLMFPSLYIASRNDPDCPFDRAEEQAGDWGSLFIDAGESGRIDDASGHGPWPEGSLTFARFISRLRH